MRKRDFIRTAGAFLLSPVPARLRSAPAPAPGRREMNLLLITADDMNWSMPGFMGGRGNLTPNLDALAARSHCFANNRTVAPICQPAREAILTGLLPHHSGGLGFTPVHEGTPTLTTLLQAQGYLAAAIHKIEHMQPHSCFPWDFAQGGEIYGRAALDRNPLLFDQGARLAMGEAEAQRRPFFVNVNINDPHRPFYGSPAGLRMDHDNQGPYKVPREVGPDEVDVPPFLEDLPEVRAELAQYANSVQRLDISIGRVLRALEESGAADNTLVVFSSDHGMPFPFAKATCYDSGTRVPVLLAWPGMGAPRRFDNLTSNGDILPTILDILGVPAPKGDGHSWLPIMQGQAATDPEFVVTYVNSVVSQVSYPTRAIQDHDYALIFAPWSDGSLRFVTESMGGLTFPAMRRAAEKDPRIAERVRLYTYGTPLAFYDLRKDPGQRANLIDDPRHRDRVARMKAALLRQMQESGDPQRDNLARVMAGQKAIVPQDHPVPPSIEA